MMKRIKAKLKSKVAEHVEKRQHVKKHLSSSSIFILVAVTAVAGYAAGTYHYQIEAFMGPVFGYKAHTAVLDLSSTQEIYNKLAANYDGNLDIQALIDGANSGLVNSVSDAYTTYMTAAEAASFDKDLTGSIGGGIGAAIGMKNDQVTIMRVLADNPAIRAGLLANDTVLKINDESVAGWTVEQAVSKIRGETGTTVKLTIRRGDEVKDYSITRDIVSNPSVETSVSDGLGIMTISRFDNETGNLAKIAAQNFKKQGVKAVVLDLRDNGGGYIDSAKEVASLWLDNKTIVTERTSGTIRETVKSNSNALLAGIPTVVLVNGVTASASEIVAGSLQDYGVATIVGEKTFGKGSVQQLIPVTGHAVLKVTIAKWYTPNGKNITQSGIIPDKIVNLTQENVNNGVDPQLDKAKEVLGL